MTLLSREKTLQVEARPLVPVSLVSRADQEAAAGPHYQAVYDPSDDPPAAPEPPPPILLPAPASHRAFWAKPDWQERVQAVSGGSE